MKFKCGILENDYTNIHKWLIRKYGAASKCENDNCKGVSKKYSHALVKGKKYEKNRDNFIMLCQSCHLKYDWDESKRTNMRIMTDSRREKIGNGNRGKKRSDEQKKRMSEINKGQKNPFFGKGIKGELNPWYGRRHSDETKRKLLQKSRKLSTVQILIIRNLYSCNIEQKKIAEKFNVSRATICRIVNNKRYVL